MKNNSFVIDTNTLISALLFEHSVPTSAYNKARKLGKIYASLDTYDELCDVIVRPKFDKYVSLENRLSVLNEINGFLVFHEVSERITACRDSKDDKFLELAISTDASCIITGDKDLLIMHPFREITIISPIDFLNNF